MTTADAPRKTRQAARGSELRDWLGSPMAGPLIILVVLAAVLSVAVPVFKPGISFVTMRSFTGIINAATLTAVITIGITLLMIAGEFDLSVGGMMAIGAFIFGALTVTRDPISAWLTGLHLSEPWSSRCLALVDPLVSVAAVLLGLLVPALLGALNGIIRIRTGIPSFIVTLGTLFIYRGALYVASTGIMLQTIAEAQVYQVFNGRMDRIADLAKSVGIEDAFFRTALLWLIGLVILFQFVLTRTRLGSHLLAAGGNANAAKAQGVNIERTKLTAFIISGVLSGLAGIMLFSQFKTAKIATGAGEELKAIAGAVVGGTLLSGGAGSVVGALIGVMLISMLRTGVILLDLPFIPADNFEAVVGVTIVLAAIFINWLRGRS